MQEINLRKKILEKKAKIGVIGLGYIGLPLSVEFSKKGFKVYGIDKDRDRLKNLKECKSYITDVADSDLKEVKKVRRLEVSDDFSLINQTDVNIICVPTPLKRRYAPDISFIKDSFKRVSLNLKRPALIILESTVYPGTIKDVILPLLEDSGLKYGEDFYLAFSPERIDPGNKRFNLRNIPKIVAGIDKTATLLTKYLYQKITKKVITASTPCVAEMAKLLENTFRIVNIALIDEMAKICHRMNVNIWEVIEKAKTKPFGFMPFYPGPGVGGSCIPKDPLYLYWKAKESGFNSSFIKLASEIISSMPTYIVERIEELLREKVSKKLKNSKILIMGVTYKRDVKDLRKSPVLEIIDILQSKEAKVSYFDPYIPYLKIGRINLESHQWNKKNLKNFDCVVIGTDHKNIDYDLILREANLIFDTRGVYHKISAGGGSAFSGKNQKSEIKNKVVLL